MVHLADELADQGIRFIKEALQAGLPLCLHIIRAGHLQHFLDQGTENLALIGGLRFEAGQAAG
ncbi:MAG: hypothetical protein ACD_10C00703G0002 [uncultured bacterium]|nr:MAG: hypothetical protein ACD_10C00703G0002 [uncultured bacterium]